MYYDPVYRYESEGRDGPLGLQILLGGIDSESLTDEERNIFSRAADKVMADLRMSMVQRDSEKIATRVETRRKLVDCFQYNPSTIYVKELPNEYCDRACCWHLPWLLVTTPSGPIKIGWRERVISIDWSASEITASANEIFPSEDVTKDGRLIHAWGYDKAKEYLAKLLV